MEEGIFGQNRLVDGQEWFHTDCWWRSGRSGPEGMGVLGVKWEEFLRSIKLKYVQIQWVSLSLFKGFIKIEWRQLLQVWRAEAWFSMKNQSSAELMRFLMGQALGHGPWGMVRGVRNCHGEKAFKKGLCRSAGPSLCFTGKETVLRDVFY